jgi:hypothetical protein
MNSELATHISLLAAPIYAAMLTPWIARGEWIPAAMLDDLRKRAIVQAQALWLETLDTSNGDPVARQPSAVER